MPFLCYYTHPPCFVNLSEFCVVTLPLGAWPLPLPSGSAWSAAGTPASARPRSGPSVAMRLRVALRPCHAPVGRMAAPASLRLGLVCGGHARLRSASLRSIGRYAPTGRASPLSRLACSRRGSKSSDCEKTHPGLWPSLGSFLRSGLSPLLTTARRFDVIFHLCYR